METRTAGVLLSVCALLALAPAKVLGSDAPPPQHPHMPSISSTGQSYVTNGDTQLPAVQLTGVIDRGRLKGFSLQALLSPVAQVPGGEQGTFVVSDGKGNSITGILIGLLMPEEDGPGGGCFQGVYQVTGGQGIFSGLTGNGTVNIDWPQGLSGPFSALFGRTVHD